MISDLGCDGDSSGRGVGKLREDPQLCLGDLSRFPEEGIPPIDPLLHSAKVSLITLG